MTTDPGFAHQSQYWLDHDGITKISGAYRNLSMALIYDQAIRRHEGRLSHLGPLLVRTRTRALGPAID